MTWRRCCLPTGGRNRRSRTDETYKSFHPHRSRAYEAPEATLTHNTLDEDALGLIARSSDGLLRAARNLTLASLIEAVRTQCRHVSLELVNRALMQPHWRRAESPVVATLAP